METNKQVISFVSRRFLISIRFEILQTADLIIGADTVVTYEGVIYEKPTSTEHAVQILSKLDKTSGWDLIESLKLCL